MEKHKDCKEEAKHGLKMSAKLWCSEHAIDAYRGIVLPVGFEEDEEEILYSASFPMLATKYKIHKCAVSISQDANPDINQAKNVFNIGQGTQKNGMARDLVVT